MRKLQSAAAAIAALAAALPDEHVTDADAWTAIPLRDGHVQGALDLLTPIRHHVPGEL